MCVHMSAKGGRSICEHSARFMSFLMAVQVRNRQTSDTRAPSHRSASETNTQEAHESVLVCYFQADVS